MATFRLPVNIVRPDLTVTLDLVGNQIAEGAWPSIGEMLAYILADGGVDEGVYVRWSVPKNFVTTEIPPQLVVKGILDGTPGAADVLGFGTRLRAVAKNELSDPTFDAELIMSEGI